MKDIEEIKKEISELQSKLDKIENQKKEEKKRWRAGINDIYFFVNDFGNVASTIELHGNRDNYRYITRNYFKTEEEAKEYKEVIKTYYDLMYLAEELNNGEKIDWNDVDQRKYAIYYDFDCNMFNEDSNSFVKELGQIYCLDEDFLEKAIEKIGEDKLIKLLTYERD